MSKRSKQSKYAKFPTTGAWPCLNKIILSSLVSVMPPRPPPRSPPSADQIAAARRRAFVREFQKEYSSKASAQEIVE